MAEQLYLYDTLAETGLDLANSSHIRLVEFTPAPVEPGEETSQQLISLEILADTAVEALDILAELERWVALARQRYGQHSRMVYLYYQPEGALKARRAPVRDGVVRRRRWEWPSRVHGYPSSFGVELELTCGFAEDEDYLLLRNGVLNPTFEIRTGGLYSPDYWSTDRLTFQAVEDVASNPTRFLLRIQCPGASNTGIVYNTGTVTTTSTYRQLDYGVEVVTFPETASRVTLQVANASTGAVLAERTITQTGWAWATTGVIASGTQCRLQVSITGGDTSDYLEIRFPYLGAVGTSSQSGTSSPIWTGQSTLYNHCDWGWEAANGQPAAVVASVHQDWTDIWNVLGDVAPDLRLLVSTDNGVRYPLVYVLSSPCSGQWMGTIQAEGLNLANGASLVTDSNATGTATNNAVSCPSTNGSWLYYMYTEINDSHMLALQGKYFRLVMVARGASVGTPFRWGVTFSSSDSSPSDQRVATPPNTSYQYYADGPIIKFPGVQLPEGFTSAKGALYIWFNSTQEVVVDRFLLVPVDAAAYWPASYTVSGYYILLADNGAWVMPPSFPAYWNVYSILPSTLIGGTVPAENERGYRIYLIQDSVVPGLNQTTVYIYIRPRWRSL